MADSYEIMASANQEIIESSGVNTLLDQIRPEWKVKKLIKRVITILPIDHSSACQKIFNASIHDLKEKIIIAGLDIAKEAATTYSLPIISKAEDVKNYRVSKIIHLAYRMGLLSRPEWRRILRVYDIRRDLEHEDDEYEATVEDCLYIFKTCIDVILSRDPVHLLKLTDVKGIVEEPVPVALSESLLEDYMHAPQPRQLDIYKFLISTALNEDHPDITRQNSYNTLNIIREHTNTQVIIDCAKVRVSQLGRKAPSLRKTRVFYAAGILPYLKKTQLRDLFTAFFQLMEKTGHQWDNYAQHGELLRNLTEIGGLDHCPDTLLPVYVEWLILCYIGEEGGYGHMGRNRKVFYSNIGAPLAFELLKNTDKDISQIVSDNKKKSRKIKRVCSDKYVDRRLDNILEEFDI